MVPTCPAKPLILYKASIGYSHPDETAITMPMKEDVSQKGTRPLLMDVMLTSVPACVSLLPRSAPVQLPGGVSQNSDFRLRTVSLCNVALKERVSSWYLQAYVVAVMRRTVPNFDLCASPMLGTENPT